MSLLARLRQETLALHERLETRLRISQLIESVDRYRWLLEKFHGFYAPLEPQLTACGDWHTLGLDMAARRKTAWLEHDLAALGATPEHIRALPRCPTVPPLPNLAAGLGCAYVLEGATLGGRHIAAMLDRSPVPASARAFFLSYGPAVGQRWKEFCAALDPAPPASTGASTENSTTGTVAVADMTKVTYATRSQHTTAEASACVSPPHTDTADLTIATAVHTFTAMEHWILDKNDFPL